MPDDIRLNIGFFSHPKTVKLIRRTGEKGSLCLIKLWCWVALNKSKGNLSGMDDEEIEIASGWDGDPGKFVEALIECRYLDGASNKRQIHDWKEHNPYVYNAEERSEIARANVQKRWDRKRKRAGIQKDTNGNANGITNRILSVIRIYTRSNTPAPAPAPAPAPYPNPNPTPKPKPTPKKKMHGDRVKLTEDEYERLKKDYGEAQVEKMIHEMNDYCVAKGEVYKDHNRALRVWFRRRGIEPKSKTNSDGRTKHKNPKYYKCPFCFTEHKTIPEKCTMCKRDIIEDRIGYVYE